MDNTNLIEFFNSKDKYCMHSGIKLIEVDKGYAKTYMDIHEYHYNGVGVVQGGAIFTLVDLAVAAASNSYGKVALTTSLNISYFKAGSGDYLYAIAKEINRGRKTGVYNINVYDQEENLIANATGTIYIKEERIDL